MADDAGKDMLMSFLLLINQAPAQFCVERERFHFIVGIPILRGYLPYFKVDEIVVNEGLPADIDIFHYLDTSQ